MLSFTPNKSFFSDILLVWFEHFLYVYLTTCNYRPWDNFQRVALGLVTSHLSENLIKVGNRKKIWKSGIGTSLIYATDDFLIEEF